MCQVFGENLTCSVALAEGNFKWADVPKKKGFSLFGKRK